VHLGKYDYLVIGSGIAGLFTALKIAPTAGGDRDKKHRAESNTNYAQAASPRS